jgi:hypothetical protein
MILDSKNLQQSAYIFFELAASEFVAKSVVELRDCLFQVLSNVKRF